MVHPSKQQTLDFIRQNSPIKTKKAFTDVYKYIHQCTYHDDTDENDINDLMISFLTNTVKDMYITTKQINSLRRYGYYHRKEFIKLPWLKYNVIKGYIPEQSQIECFTEFFDFDTVVELLKRHKDINSHIYFKNYNVLDKLFRNNNELFKIDTKDPKELDKLKKEPIKMFKSALAKVGSSVNKFFNKAVGVFGKKSSVKVASEQPTKTEVTQVLKEQKAEKSRIETTITNTMC